MRRTKPLEYLILALALIAATTFVVLTLRHDRHVHLQNADHESK